MQKCGADHGCAPSASRLSGISFSCREFVLPARGLPPCRPEPKGRRMVTRAPLCPGKSTDEVRLTFIRCNNCCAVLLSGVCSIFFCLVWWLGFVQMPRFRTNWSHVAERTSPSRAPVRISSLIASACRLVGVVVECPQQFLYLFGV